MNERARMMGGRTLAFWVAFGLLARGASAQEAGAANPDRQAQAASIASRFHFQTLDLKTLAPAGPVVPAVRDDPRATRSFTFDWTSDMVSYLVYAESGSGSVDITLPSGPERPYSTGAAVSFVYPGADLPVKSGKYSFDLAGGGSGAATVTASVRRGSQPGSGTLDFNFFVLDGCGLTQQGLAEGMLGVQEIFADAGIRLGELNVVVLSASETYLSPGSFEEAQALFGSVSRQLTASPPKRLAANLFFTRKVPTAYGFSQGIPAALGLPGTSSGGVVINVSAHNTDQGFDSHELGLTIAHETGHSMGLYHTSEGNGARHDTIADTPECGGGDADVCPDGTNIMFWSGHFPNVSAGQAYVLRRSPIVH